MKLLIRDCMFGIFNFILKLNLKWLEFKKIIVLLNIYVFFRVYRINLIIGCIVKFCIWKEN